MLRHVCWGLMVRMWWVLMSCLLFTHSSCYQGACVGAFGQQCGQVQHSDVSCVHTVYCGWAVKIILNSLQL